jgi:hypothetical protein
VLTGGGLELGFPAALCANAPDPPASSAPAIAAEIIVFNASRPVKRLRVISASTVFALRGNAALVWRINARPAVAFHAPGRDARDTSRSHGAFCPRVFLIDTFKQPRHCEERSDEAIQTAPPDWIASLRSQ